jgi:hypothetical protein
LYKHPKTCEHKEAIADVTKCMAQIAKDTTKKMKKKKTAATASKTSFIKDEDNEGSDDNASVYVL